MPILLEELIAKIPSSTERRVESTKARFNQAVRTALRQETRLQLNRAEQDGQLGARKHEVTSVRIYLLPGLPVSLEKKELSDDLWLSVLLGPWRSTLESLRDSSLATQELTKQILADPRGTSVLGGREQHLQPVFELAESLLKVADSFNLVEWILRVDEDVLGIYRYRLPQKDQIGLFGPKEEPADGSIELYWGVIGLVAGWLGKSVEDLTLVVLAHELAHAYTHLGTDIDGHRWKASEFHDSEHGLKEGLAQYYTKLVCDRLTEQAPGCLSTYEALLQNQPPAYHTHQPWVEQYYPEEVRSAMIESRRRGKATNAAFERRLKTARSRLRNPSNRWDQISD